jgi:hypothetical protein
MIEREKSRNRERKRTEERGREEEQKSEVFCFLMRRFRGTRRVAIRGMLSGGDIILPHTCPRATASLDEVVFGMIPALAARFGK